MPKCSNCDTDMFLVWDPYGKVPPRWICYGCGYISAGVVATPQEKTEAVKTFACSKCGKLLVAGTLQCPSCGEMTNETAEELAQPQGDK